MQIQLSDHFTYKNLLRFAFPSIVMMIFTSIYSVVDGLFVSNFVGDTEFAAINLIMPYLIIVSAFGFMIGTGGTALVSKTLGEDDTEKANRLFSMLVYVAIILAALIGTVSFVFCRPIAVFLGAEGEMIEHCVLYGRIMVITLPCFTLQNLFQSFLITAEKPKLGLYVTVAAGITNMVLDALFVGVLGFGLAGAAVASAISQLIGATIPMIYFMKRERTPLRLVGFSFDGMALLRASVNGSSEFVSNISASVVNMVYNFSLLSLIGEDGVSAFGVIMYVQFIFVGIYYGFALSITPVVGFHYGAGNKNELKSLLKKSLILIGIAAVILTGLAELLSSPLAQIFVGYKPELFGITKHAFRIYAISYLICGFNIFGSAFFTALNNGLVSGVISFMRTFVFQLACLILIPLMLPEPLKLDGIWLAIVAAELLSLSVTLIFLIGKRKKYGYM